MSVIAVTARMNLMTMNNQKRRPTATLTWLRMRAILEFLLAIGWCPNMLASRVCESKLQ